MEEHPDYPSLLAVSDCLTSWNIPNQSFQLNKETYNINELALPCIAYLKTDSEQLILIKDIQNNIVHFANENESNGKLTKEQFLAQWDGVILYAEKHYTSGEPNYKNALIKGVGNQARIPFLITMALASILYAIDYSSISSAYMFMLMIKLFGVGISILLLMHSADSNNAFVQNLCSLGNNNDCNTILKSEAASVTNWLTWSEVGLFYFSGTFIFLLLRPFEMGLISWLNLLALPYTFYSIGYQAKIKNWCFLCCSVQVLLWLEAIVFFSNDFSLHIADLNIKYSTFIFTLLCFLFPVALWSCIKPLLLKSRQILPIKQQLKKFKYNTSLFNILLSSQTKYVIPDDLMPIVFGNPKAKTVITVVSNPFCQPCAVAHQQLETWLNQRNDLQLKIVFTTADNDDDNRTKIARHVTALSKLENKNIAKEALTEWFSDPGKKYESWAKKYPVVFSAEMNFVTKRQKEWCNLAEISFTPTIFINGYKLVNPYRLEDVKYLLE